MVLLVKIFVCAPRKALAFNSSCTSSSGTTFVNCASRDLLWYTFQTVANIAYNLNIFKQGDMLMRQFFIALFCFFVQRVYDLKN